MVEVIGDVALHRPDELEADGGGGHHVQVDPVPEFRPVLVDELVHRRLVVALAGLQIGLESLARTGLVGLEFLTHLVVVAGHVQLVAVLEEDAIVWVEPFEVVVVARFLPEVREEALEDVGHQIPRRPHIERKPLGLQLGGSAADLLVLFQDPNVGVGVGQITRRRETTKATADDNHVFSGEGTHCYALGSGRTIKPRQTGLV